MNESTAKRALRESLKSEDASIEQRLPAPAAEMQSPGEAKARAVRKRPAEAAAGPQDAGPAVAVQPEPRAKRSARVKAAPAAEPKPAEQAGPTEAPVPAVAESKGKADKVVRDSISMPAGEHAELKALRSELAKAGTKCSKSELLRAGLRILSGMAPEQAISLVASLPALRKKKARKK